MSRAVSGWRKLAGSMWSAPSDPQFYGEMEVDAAALLAYLDEVRHKTGVHATVTHLVGKAVGYALGEVPSLRVRLALGREYPRETIDVFFVVAAPGEQLSGVKITAVDTKPLPAIAVELHRRSRAIQADEDPEFGRTKAMLDWMPRPLLRLAMRLSAFLTSDLNLDLPRLGLPRQAFGGAFVSSVGMWGISRAWSPLAPYYRLPLLVLAGAVEEKAVVVAGQVVARPMLTLTATFDHRYTDGSQAVEFAKALRAYLSHPAAFEPPLSAWEPSESPSAT